MKFNHVSIMKEQCMELLNIRKDGIYVDCTAGGGGHSQAILDRLSQDGRLICIDKDTDALTACRERFGSDARVSLVHSDYKDFSSVMNDLGIDKVDGILIDLGISSYQIDNYERGFSYMSVDAPLDMRMDRTQPLDAAFVLNNYTENQIADILRYYGEESFASAIAREIVKQRLVEPFKTCGQLVAVTDRIIPAAVKRKTGHSAKKTFQALRIEVNKELEGLDKALHDMIDRLKSGGRIVIITFHSLEDRIVKHCFADCQTDCICPPEFPVCVCDHRAIGKLVNKKPIVPDSEEIKVNSRSASAKLRALEKL